MCMEVLAVSNSIGCRIKKKAESIHFAKTIKYTHINFWKKTLEKEKLNSLRAHKYSLLFVLLMEEEKHQLAYELRVSLHSRNIVL